MRMNSKRRLYNRSFCLWNEYILFSLENEGVKPNENPHRCPYSTQRFRKGRIRVGRKCFQRQKWRRLTQIYPQKEETVKKAVEKAITLEEVRSVLANLSRSGQKETVLKLLQKYGGSRLSEVSPERYAALFADAQEAAHAE